MQRSLPIWARRKVKKVECVCKALCTNSRGEPVIIPEDFVLQLPLAYRRAALPAKNFLIIHYLLSSKYQSRKNNK